MNQNTMNQAPIIDRQLKPTMSTPNTIKHRSNVRSTSDRLSKLISNSMITNSIHSSTHNDISVIDNNNNQTCPMISLPENYQYWSEGWKSKNFNESLSNNDDLVISSSSLSSPMSSASSSPSPSPSNQSVNSNKINGLTSFDFDSNNEQVYRDAFIGKVWDFSK